MPAAHHSLPSPSSSASLSPRQLGALKMERRHSSASDDEHDHLDHHGHDPVARSALEIRREKNRIKQRNLRLRRANQMADLEQTVGSMRSTTLDLENQIVVLEARAASLTAWVRDLEAALVAHGHREHVESLRRMWGSNLANAVPTSSAMDMHSAHHVAGPPSSSASRPSGSSSSSVDPLSTLASAASSYRPRPPRWDTRDMEQHDRKRRRDEYDDESAATAAATAAAVARGHRLPSPSRMRIAELVLPHPRPQHQGHPGQPPQPPAHSQPSSSQSESWGWNHLPSLDQSYSQDKRASAHSHPGHYSHQAYPSYSHPHAHAATHGHHDHGTAGDSRRPLSSSSGASARTHTSPVHSFDIRI
ncbi:uncharacterized protein LOC62_04G005892 [Vanrija pseudolonga]|uniref:BZIP domain-containing protein n=1 Tax=Vanrija pseudolonga TaxID=143232 RepID=A0AAF0YF72_9TREE|nr:hypothetical protein LOC62_04G005892 [Vanrija pseudolonga]